MEKKGQSSARPWLIFALVALVALSLFRMRSTTAKPRELTAVEFGEALAANRVVEPLKRVTDRDEGTTYLEGEIMPESPKAEGEGGKGDGKANAAGRQRFRVELVPGENEELMNDLRKKGVRVESLAIIESMGSDSLTFRR